MITRQIEIPCTQYEKEYTYQFSYKDKVLARGIIPGCCLFDLQGDTLDFPCKSAQDVYCFAKPDMILADELYEVKPNIILGFSLWGAYLSEQTPIVLDNRLYGIDSETSLASSRKVGYTIGHDSYNQVKFHIDKDEYPVIGEYPTYFLRYRGDAALEDDIRISVDGVNVPYLIISNSLLLDGSGEVFYRVKIAPSVPLANGKIVCLRMFCISTKQEFLSVFFFVLKKLEYAFSKELYFKDKNVTLMHLDFEDKDRLFAGHYKEFPKSLSKYKLHMENDQDCRLVFLPPLIEVKANGMSLFDQDCWYTELSEGEDITVSIPQEVTSAKLFTWDSRGNVRHELKKRGESYKVQYLRQEPETSDSFVTLGLSAFGRNKQRFNHDICKLYYKVSPKPQTRSPMSYIPPPKQIRLSNIQVGLHVKQEFYCDKNSKYVVKLFNAKNILIASWSMQNSTSMYHQDSDIVGGIYKLLVFENIRNNFTKKESERQVFSQEISYKVNEQKCPITPYNNDVKPDEQSVTWHEIHILNSMKRVWSSNGTTFERVKKLASFHFKTNGTMEQKEICRAVGYFLDTKGNRYEMTEYNPLKVTVIKKCKDDKIIFSVYDREGKPLKVGEKCGHINPLYPMKDERLCECYLFEGLVIR